MQKLTGYRNVRTDPFASTLGSSSSILTTEQLQAEKNRLKKANLDLVECQARVSSSPESFKSELGSNPIYLESSAYNLDCKLVQDCRALGRLSASIRWSEEENRGLLQGGQKWLSKVKLMIEDAEVTLTHHREEHDKSVDRYSESEHHSRLLRSCPFP